MSWPTGTQVTTPTLTNLVGLDDAFAQAVNALKSRKHLILIGPPGTGKTELALAICDQLQTTAKSHVPYDIVTATSDWTTFETVGGYFPNTDPGNAHLDFTPGVVSYALLRQRWLIIDEINRADIDKAFGELFTLLAGRSARLPFYKRNGAESLPVVLGNATDAGMMSGEKAFEIPESGKWPNWRDDFRIIGTMNTFDKASLFQLSFAFLRRFAFVHVNVPTATQLRTILDKVVDDGTEDPSDPVWDKCLTSLVDLFAPADGLAHPTLKTLDLLVGPAIVIDVVRYLKQREPTWGEDEHRVPILEALELYLYPQFEGQDRKHPQIVAAIQAVLGQVLDGKSEDRLRTWTGRQKADKEKKGGSG